MKNNQVQLIGYVGKDLSSTTLPGGDRRIAIRVATHYSGLDKNGEKIYFTTWHEVTAWNNVAEYAERNFVKGSKIMVDGSIEYRTYADKTGHTRYYTQIKAHSLMNLDR